MSINNNVRLLGNVVADPEVNYNPKGIVVATICLATTEFWKDKKTDEWKEENTWHTIICWGEMAKAIERRVKKGTSMTIEGRLANDSWQDNDGKKNYKVFIKIEQYHIHGGEKDR